MVVEPLLHFGVERSLRVLEEKTMNVTAAERSVEELPDAVHNGMGCRPGPERFS